jgi:nicotinic acetylcholine receptor, invertebrate
MFSLLYSLYIKLSVQIETFLCGWMATIMRMKRPDKEDEDEKKKFSKKSLYLMNMSNGLSYGQSSKSLLANVLNTSDDFGVLKSNKIKSKIVNNRINGFNSHCPNGQPYLKRENSGLSQSIYECSNEVALTANKNDYSTLKRSLNAILKELRCMTQKLKDDEEEEEQSLNWKFAAMVIDRLCMYFFLIATFISTASILFTSSNLYKSSDPDPKF